MEEIKLENAEFVENADVPLEIKIKYRLAELQEIRVKVVEQLKAQQQAALNPIDAVIAELTDLLPKEAK